MATSKTNGRQTHAYAASKPFYRLFHDVLGLVDALARRRMSMGADALHSAAQTTRSYAASMTDLPNLRNQATAASESLDGLADYALHTDVEHMALDAVAFARKHPFVTIGATLAASVATALYLRAIVPVAVEPKLPRKAIQKRSARKRAIKRSGANRTRIQRNGSASAVAKHA